MPIARFRHDAALVMRHFDLKRSTGEFEMYMDHVYSGDPVARTFQWTSERDDEDRRACGQMMAMLRVVSERDWFVLDFAAPELQHRQPQAGAKALGKARAEWHIATFHSVTGEPVIDSGYMLFEDIADFEAVRDELLLPLAA